MVDRFALHRLARPRPRDDEVEGLREAMRALFAAHVMSDDERACWDERLSRAPGR
ncbi:MAG TPA: hypothetical protein VIL48_22350 [Acidimicrobiales bacterium]